MSPRPSLSGRRQAHLALVRRVLDLELREDAREAFADILERLTTEKHRRCFSAPTEYAQVLLTGTQEARALRLLGEEPPEPETRLTAGEVPRGREVPVPAVLRVLPKRPPGRP